MKNLKNEKEGKSSSDWIIGFYEKMPRFVHELPDVSEAGFLLPVQRLVEWNNEQFTLTIVPACRIDQAAKDKNDVYRNLFPGTDEELLEKTLRRLSVAGNINFDAKNSMLCFSLTHIIDEYAAVTDDSRLTRERLEISLSLLYDVKYALKLGTREFHFRPIEGLKWVESGSETYYRICFTPFFFDRGELFDRIFGDQT